MKPGRLLPWLRRRRVAVLKGGWSRERPISFKTGEAVEASFHRMGIRPIGIDVQPDILTRLQKEKIQFCFNALHGPFGEDGQIQTYLDYLRIPYTGSDPTASAVAMDKDLSKRLFRAAGIPTPAWVLAGPDGGEKKAERFMGARPVFIKPFDQGSAIGATKVLKKNEITQALQACFRVSRAALVERFVAGRELTVGILGEQALPVIEIIPEHIFYDFHSKYVPGGSRHLVPAPLTKKQTRVAQQLSLRAFAALGCTVYGRVDLILDKNGGMTVLEVNSIPGMTSTSLLPEAAQAVGLDFDGLVLKIVELSLEELSLKELSLS